MASKCLEEVLAKPLDEDQEWMPDIECLLIRSEVNPDKGAISTEHSSSEQRVSGIMLIGSTPIFSPPYNS